jgi:cellulose synthase/poly-beta-1,6-N-acetylglucosamine synthase-like glycosyltransferase
VSARGVACAVAIVAAAAATIVAKPSGSATVRHASNGAELQKALSDAQPGDTIALTGGATFEGPFHLPKKDGSDWIEIRPDFDDAEIGPTGVPVQPSARRPLPRLRSGSDSVIVADSGAHHYRLVGLDIAPDAGVFLTNVILFGSGSQTAADVPHDLDVERCVVHGDATKGSRRGIALNGAEIRVADSFFRDFKEVGADSQAIAGWNGPGPFHILNNQLEGAGENVLFGGADPSIDGLIPSDIEVRGNRFVKPLSWRQGDRTYAGTHWSVKNLFELKNARRVVVDSNLFAFNWVDAQNGFAVLFTVRNQDGASPWSAVTDVTFTNNIVMHAPAGINILGTDDINHSAFAERIIIRNNLFEDIGGQWTNGRLLQVLNGARNVTFDHNTAFQTDTVLFGGDTAPNPGFVFTNNIAPHNQYGIIGGSTAIGSASIDRYFPGGVFKGNVIAGGRADVYPGGNFFPPSMAAVGFIGQRGATYQLAPSSLFKGHATDGADPGVDPAGLAQVPTALPDPESASADPLDRSRSPEKLAVATVWLSIAALLYAYVGYPALMWVLARVAGQPVRSGRSTPDVSIVVVAHNEGIRIAARIENLLALTYPADRKEIVVASDGSTDDTVERANAFGDRVRVEAYRERRGKPAVLNQLVPSVRGEIVLLADARQDFDPSALQALVDAFADARVGAASGALSLERQPDPSAVSQAGSEGAAVYWSYEKGLRWAEARFDSTIGATGAIYAIRRALFEPMPDDTILDDVVTPMRIARQGRRVVFEPAARAYDHVSASDQHEFRRKARTMAGNFQMFARERWLLNPFQNRLWFQTMSHKALRLTLPLWFAALLVSTGSLVGTPLYGLLFAGQLLFYAVAVFAAIAPAARRRVPGLVVPYAMCFLSAATIAGACRFAFGRQRVTWEREPVRT